MTKKRYKLLTAAMSMLVAAAAPLLTSCSDDDENDYTFSTNAEQDAQGTYSGTYVKVRINSTDTIRATGSFVIEPTGEKGVAQINFSSSELTELNNQQPIVINIAHADQGFVFFNKSSENGIQGRIDANRTLSTSFSKAVRSGRSTVRYNYVFQGNR